LHWVLITRINEETNGFKTLLSQLQPKQLTCDWRNWLEWFCDFLLETCLFYFMISFPDLKKHFLLSLTLGRVIRKLSLLKSLKIIVTWSILILNHQVFVIVLFLFLLYQNQLFNTPSGTLSLSCRMQCCPVRCLSKISCNFVC
jgi:hypothetical protein